MMIDVIERWTYGEPATLKGFWPGVYPFCNDVNVFEKVKKGMLEQYNERLEYLMYREIPIQSGKVDGMNIECQLDQIARKCRTKKQNLFHGDASIIDHSFSVDQ